MEKDKTVTVLISSFVLVILALAFISTISTSTNQATTKSNAVDEAYNLTGVGCYSAGQVNESKTQCAITVANAPTGWEQADCPLTSVVVTNTTGTALTLTTDYTVSTSTGVITLKNTTATNLTRMGNNVLFDYTYCGTGYVDSSWGRSVLGTNVGILGIAVLAVVIAAVYLLLGKRDDD
jgi:hypothetical protein